MGKIRGKKNKTGSGVMGRPPRVPVSVMISQSCWKHYADEKSCSERPEKPVPIAMAPSSPTSRMMQSNELSAWSSNHGGPLPTPRRLPEHTNSPPFGPYTGSTTSNSSHSTAVGDDNAVEDGEQPQMPVTRLDPTLSLYELPPSLTPQVWPQSLDSLVLSQSLDSQMGPFQAPSQRFQQQLSTSSTDGWLSQMQILLNGAGDTFMNIPVRYNPASMISYISENFATLSGYLIAYPVPSLAPWGPAEPGLPVTSVVLETDVARRKLFQFHYIGVVPYNPDGAGLLIGRQDMALIGAHLGYPIADTGPLWFPEPYQAQGLPFDTRNDLAHNGEGTSFFHDCG